MRTLREGSRGPLVQLLQLALNRSGIAVLQTDGRFGNATREAVAAFQRRMGLKPDGVVGEMTHRALRPWYTGYLTHRVRRGESFWSISRLYGAELGAVMAANPALAPESIPLGAEIAVPLPFAVVPTGIDYCAELVACCVEGLAARYPALRAGSIGRSALGRPLWSLQMGQGANRVLYNAAHHANEWITIPVLLRFADWQQEQFYLSCRETVLAMAKKNPLTEADAESAVRFFYTLMDAYWRGALAEEREAIEQMEGYAPFFRAAEGYSYGWWLKDLLETVSPKLKGYALGLR